MKATGSTISNTAKAEKPGTTAANMKANTKMVKKKDLVSTCGMTVVAMKVCGKKTK